LFAIVYALQIFQINYQTFTYYIFSGCNVGIRWDGYRVLISSLFGASWAFSFDHYAGSFIGINVIAIICAVCAVDALPFRNEQSNQPSNPTSEKN
jgi:hypothetical protein